MELWEKHRVLIPRRFVVVEVIEPRLLRSTYSRPGLSVVGTPSWWFPVPAVMALPAGPKLRAKLRGTSVHPFLTPSIFQPSISPPTQAQIVCKMARIRKTSRRNCQNPDPAINLSPKSPRKANTMVDTPRRVRLLADAQSTTGKMTRKELFKLHGIAKTTGYRILKEKSARRSERIYNRGRKKAIENANFRFRTASHLANASAISLAYGSERAIQRNIAEYRVRTYIAK
jgi:hypothetical protein